jgi:hypothetical protein
MWMAWGLLGKPGMEDQSLIDLGNGRRPFDVCAHVRSLGKSLRQLAIWSLLISSGATVLVPAAYGSEIPEWPHEREARLETVESQILDVQRALFAARMSQDDAKRAELEIKMKKLEDEQVKLLRASGHLRPE